MKKKLLVLLLFLLATLNISTADAARADKTRWFERDSRIEVVNDKTIIFKDVIKIEIRSNDKNQITYVYDLKHSKLVKVARGAFDVDPPRGNYLVQSDKRITKTVYEVIVE